MRLFLLQFYLDELVIDKSNILLINDLKSDLKGAFQMSDLGELNYFLSLQVCRLHDELFIY